MVRDRPCEEAGVQTEYDELVNHSLGYNVSTAALLVKIVDERGRNSDIACRSDGIDGLVEPLSE